MNAPEKDRERVRDVLTLPAGDLALTPALYLPSFPALSLSFPICIMVTRRAARLEGPASCNVLSRVRKRSPGEEQEGGLSLSHTDRLRLVQPAWMGVCPAHARARGLHLLLRPRRMVRGQEQLSGLVRSAYPSDPSPGLCLL